MAEALAPAPVARPSARRPGGTALDVSPRRVVRGDQVAKDWTREPEGFVLFEPEPAPAGGGGGGGAEEGIATATATGTGPGGGGRRVCTGPFEAHFVAACGALADALERAFTSSSGADARRIEREKTAASDRGTRPVDENENGPREVEDSEERANARRAPRLCDRWMKPPPKPREGAPASDRRRRRPMGGDGDPRDGDERENGPPGDFPGEARLARDSGPRAADGFAAGAARVMLAASRTVRGGDALDLILRLFPGPDISSPSADGGVTAASSVAWAARALGPDEARRVLLAGDGGPSAGVRATAAGCVVTARDVFLVSRLGSGSGGAGGEGPGGCDGGDPDPDPDPDGAVAVATRSEQVLEWRRDARDAGGGEGGEGDRRGIPGRLELVAQNVGLDPLVPRAVLDAFARERDERRLATRSGR